MKKKAKPQVKKLPVSIVLTGEDVDRFLAAKQRDKVDANAVFALKLVRLQLDQQGA